MKLSEKSHIGFILHEYGNVEAGFLNHLETRGMSLKYFYHILNSMEISLCYYLTQNETNVIKFFIYDNHKKFLYKSKNLVK